MRYLAPYLLESGARDVRQNFSQLLERTLASHLKHTGSSDSPALTAVLTHLIEMIARWVYEV